MKTLADAKRALVVGASLTLVNAPGMPNHKFLNVPRFVIKTQGNGVSLGLTPDATKGSFLELPRASLVDFDGKTLNVYEAGERDMTEKEQEVYDNMPSHREENATQCERDIMTDTSIMYWKDLEYLRNHGMEYLTGSAKRGLRYRFNDKKVSDESIKGKLSLSYTIA